MYERRILALSLVSLCLVPFGLKADEISFSSSVRQGMAGASLAVMDRPERKLFDNPAAVAMVSGPKFAFSGVTVQRENIGIGQVFDLFKFQNSGATQAQSAVTNILKFGDHTRTKVTISTDLGYTIPGVAVSAGMTGDMRLLCNDDLVNWNTGRGGNIDLAKSDAIGMAVMSFPDITLGSTIPSHGQLAVGGRLRILNAVYSHFYADGMQLHLASANRAAEMGSNDVLKSHGLGIDLGALYRPDNQSSMSYAVVISNAIEPDISFPTSPIWAANRNSISANNIHPMKRTVNLGSAYHHGQWLAAADLMDICHNANLTELRLGAEYAVSNKLALRAGYATLSGYAAGLSIGGFSIAITETQPATLSHQMKF